MQQAPLSQSSPKLGSIKKGSRKQRPSRQGSWIARKNSTINASPYDKDPETGELKQVTSPGTRKKRSGSVSTLSRAFRKPSLEDKGEKQERFCV